MDGMKGKLLTLRCEGEVALYLKRASLFAHESMTTFILKAALERANGLREVGEDREAWGAKQPPELRDGRRKRRGHRTTTKTGAGA